MAAINFSSLTPPYPGLGSRRHFLGAPFDCFAKEAVIDLIGGSGATSHFRYLVTPNVDHVVRLKNNHELYEYYQAAWMSLCDSRPIAALAHLRSLRLPLVTGSDLTAVLFASVIKKGDLVTLIAANKNVVRDMKAAFPTVHFRAIIPPQGVWNDSAALNSCIDFVVHAEARFVFIAIGSPQSEKIAFELSRHPEARGVGFCVGASLEFLVGSKKRAPLWMRHSGLEWLHRLASDPKRLWRRYFGAVVPLVGLFFEELLGRPRRHG